VEKTFYGRKYWGVARTTFLIDEQGRIARVFEKVDPEGHADEVAEAIAALA
jgi:thioredoxin-dependent peroxiredoxin